MNLNLKLKNKTAVSAIISVFLSAPLFSFDWPQNEIMSNSFFSYFGELRGGLLSPSLIFSGSEEIKAADKGRIIAVLSEHDEESDLFESTLGNAAIIAHESEMLTVYANLDSEEKDSLFSLSNVESGTSLGYCGNSGWQTGDGLLEFQVVDSKNRTFINPRILMPRFGDEPALSLRNITLVNRRGVSFDLNTQRNIESGTYYIYRDRQNMPMIYESKVFLNGAVAGEIIYDTLEENNGRLTTRGTEKFSSKTVYPDTRKHLLAQVSIPKGRNRITITVSDILGKEHSLTYSITAY